MDMVGSRISSYFLLFFVLISIWRRVSKKKNLQERIHKLLKQAAVLIQWYTIFFLGLISFLVYSIVEFFKDYVSVSDQEINDNLHRIFDNTKSAGHLNSTVFDDFKADLSFPLWVKIINVIGQISGIVVVSIVIYHAWAFLIIPLKKAAEESSTWSIYPWHPPKRINWVLWIIILPSMFSIETMRANIKVWGIVTGKAPEFEEMMFTPAEKLELLYAREDIQIASLFQFTAIYAFTRLISSVFENTVVITGQDDEEKKKLALEYKRLIRLGGFQGLWIYIIAGVLRAFFTILVAVILQFVIHGSSDAENSAVIWFENLEDAFDSMIGITFILLTVLSIVNMIIMSRTYIIADRLGDANKKFIGIRIMLICSEVVPKVIGAFIRGTPTYNQLQIVTSYVSFLYMSKVQGELLKIAILNMACLVTAIINFIFWKDLDIEKAGLLDFPDHVEDEEQPSESLLSELTSSSYTRDR